MSRYLFAVPPLAGHVTPAAGVASELERRGHQVGWVAHEAVVRPMLGADAHIYPAGDQFLDHIVGHLAERERVKGAAAAMFLWDRVLVPLASDMLKPVEKAVDDFGPDVVVADQQAFAAAIVASEQGLPWATSAAMTADLVGPPANLPKVGEWIRSRLDGLYRELGRPELATAGFDPRFSPHLVLAYSTADLVGEGVAQDMALAFVGPVLTELPELVPFPWEWLEGHHVNILVTLGTVNHDIGGRFLRRVVEAVAGRPYGVVLVGPDGLGAETVDNVLTRPFVPQLELFSHIDAMVCHAGHNTALGALAHGVPVVCAPIRDDHPATAGQIAAAGAGVRISFGRARPPEIARAIDAVLEDPSYAQGAERIAASFRSAGGAPTAADHLERLDSSARRRQASRGLA